MSKCVFCNKKLISPVGLICPDCAVKNENKDIQIPFERISNLAPEIKEEVNHPQRYGGDTVYECIKVLKAWGTPEEYRGFLKFNVIKYLCRLGKKDDPVQEAEKAQFYLNKLIESLKE